MHGKLFWWHMKFMGIFLRNVIKHEMACLHRCATMLPHMRLGFSHMHNDTAMLRLNTAHMRPRAAMLHLLSAHEWTPCNMLAHINKHHGTHHGTWTSTMEPVCTHINGYHDSYLHIAVPRCRHKYEDHGTNLHTSKGWMAQIYCARQWEPWDTSTETYLCT